MSWEGGNSKIRLKSLSLPLPSEMPDTQAMIIREPLFLFPVCGWLEILTRARVYFAHYSVTPGRIRGLSEANTFPESMMKCLI